MLDSIDIIAIITPAAGKADRVQQLLSETAAHVEANEPGALRYHLQRQTSGETPVFVMLETYKDKAAIAAHGSSSAFKALGGAFKDEGLLAEPMKVLFTTAVAGFASRL